jgi:integrase
VAKKKPRRSPNGMPWYWAARDVWVTPGDRKNTPLRNVRGEVVCGKDNKAEARRVWFDAQALTHAGRAGIDNPVKTILEAYLQGAAKRVSAKTLKSYTDWYQSFADHHPGLLVRELKTRHIEVWWESHTTWGQTVRNMSGAALKAAFKWAAAAGNSALISSNPLDGFRLPTARKRNAEVVVSRQEFDSLLALVKSEPVRDILVVAWETGTRPANLARVTRRNLTDAKNALMLDGSNTEPGSAVHKVWKKTGRGLVIPLPPKARDIVLRLASRFPQGPLFRTANGLPWTAVRLANIIRHYAKRAGLKGRFTAYGCRHSRITSLLEAGVNPTDVAAIVGNTPDVIHRHYSHVSANVERSLKIMQAADQTG